MLMVTTRKALLPKQGNEGDFKLVSSDKQATPTHLVTKKGLLVYRFQAKAIDASQNAVLYANFYMDGSPDEIYPIQIGIEYRLTKEGKWTNMLAELTARNEDVKYSDDGTDIRKYTRIRGYCMADRYLSNCSMGDQKLFHKRGKVHVYLTGENIRIKDLSYQENAKFVGVKTLVRYVFRFLIRFAIIAIAEGVVVFLLILNGFTFSTGSLVFQFLDLTAMGLAISSILIGIKGKAGVKMINTILAVIFKLVGNYGVFSVPTSLASFKTTLLVGGIIVYLIAFFFYVGAISEKHNVLVSTITLTVGVGISCFVFSICLIYIINLFFLVILFSYFSNYAGTGPVNVSPEDFMGAGTPSGLNPNEFYYTDDGHNRLNVYTQSGNSIYFKDANGNDVRGYQGSDGVVRDLDTGEELFYSGKD